MTKQAPAATTNVVPMATAVHRAILVQFIGARRPASSRSDCRLNSAKGSRAPSASEHVLCSVKKVIQSRFASFCLRELLL
jgi:hypothetical protein